MGSLLLILVLGTFCLGFLLLHSSLITVSPSSQAIAPEQNQQQLAFIPNVGQFDPNVHFQTQGSESTLFFTTNGVVLALPPKSKLRDISINTVDHRESPLTGISSILKLCFEGANVAPNIVAHDQLPGMVNYFLGNQPETWHTSIPTYRSIVYQQLYPGIDLHYNGSVGTLKGTYIVAPGADPSHIGWRYEGARDVIIDRVSGDLLITLPSAADSPSSNQVIEHAPVAWQDIGGQREPVGIRYRVVHDTLITFEIDGYDPTYPLVIDPALDYSTYLGGGGGENGLTLAVDDEGAMYVAGWTHSLDFQSYNQHNWWRMKPRMHL